MSGTVRIRAEVALLRTPAEVEHASADHDQRQELDRRRARVIDMYESGHLDRAEFQARITAVERSLAALDARRVVVAVPQVDWSWSPKRLNGVLRAIFDRIELDPASFQPVGFEWTVPEWRAVRPLAG